MPDPPRPGLDPAADNQGPRRENGEPRRLPGERLALLAEALPVLMAYVNADQRYEFANAAYDRLFAPPGGALGRRVEEVLGPEVYQRVGPHVRGVLAGTPQGFEVEVPAGPHGPARRMRTSLVPHQDQEGRTLGFFVHSVDISELKNIEDELRRNQERYRLLVENAGEGVLVGQDGLPVFFNHRVLEIIGYGAEEFARRPYLDHVHPDHRQLVLERTRRRLAGEDMPSPYDIKIIDAQGATRWLQVSAVRIEWEGRPAILNFLTDVSARHQAEEALRRAEAQFRALVENTPDLVVRFDRDMRHVYVSPALGRCLDLDPRGLLGRTHRELGLPEEHCRFWEKGLGRVLASGQPLEDEYSVLAKGGEVLFNRRLFPEMGPEGQVASVIAVCRDITAHRKAERDYQQLFMEMIDGFALHEIILDGQGRPVDYRFLAVNPAFEEATGLKAGDLVGRTVRQVLPGVEESWIERYGQVALTGEPLHFEEYTAALDRHFEVRAYRPAPGQFATILVDITQRKRGEADRARLEDQLRQAQKMEAIGTLAGGIAHDFNNILAAVLGFAELAQEMAHAGESNADELSQIVQAAERARNLVRQILTFSRKVKSDMRPLDLNRAVGQAVRMLERTLPKMVAIETSLEAGLPPISADPAQVEQVLLNLAGNAADAMPEGGRLAIETRKVTLDEEYCRHHLEVRPGPYVLLKVSDEGQGMDQETLDHLFEPFFTTKAAGKGTGLGLSMVFGVVKSHGGYIQCRSGPGQGATFLMYFPALEGPGQREDEEGRPGTAQARGDATVLIVDDEPTLLALGQRMLVSKGYLVLAAHSGEEALEVYREHLALIDLVILDLGMPGMGGLKCLEELLALNPRAKVLIASGYATDGHVKRSLQTGALGFVAKPYSRSEMLEMVERALAG